MHLYTVQYVMKKDQSKKEAGPIAHSSIGNMSYFLY